MIRSVCLNEKCMHVRAHARTHPRARRTCIYLADNQDRDVDLYHWSSAKFESTWRDTLSVLVARGRAQVGVHSAKTDWSRRILDFQYMDYDDQAAHHA